jgi:hypothetical protein
VLHGAVHVALEHGAADALAVAGVLVVAHADVAHVLARVQAQRQLLRVQLLGKGACRLDVAVVL